MMGEGHFGLTLIALSLIGLPFGLGPDYSMVMIIIIGVALSSLPDIDLRTDKVHHRGITHSLLFAIIAGLIVGTIFGYLSGFIWGIIGFIGGFCGIILHLLGDVFTFHKFRPLYPFDAIIFKRKIYLGFGLFYANNKSVNSGFFILGCMTCAFYLAYSLGYI